MRLIDRIIWQLFQWLNAALLTVCVVTCVSVLPSGVNLLVGTESGLMLLDRSGQGKVYPLINRRRIQQMDVLEGLNVLVTISGTVHQLNTFPFLPF